MPWSTKRKNILGKSPRTPFIRSWAAWTLISEPAGRRSGDADDVRSCHHLIATGGMTRCRRGSCFLDIPLLRNLLSQAALGAITTIAIALKENSLIYRNVSIGIEVRVFLELEPAPLKFPASFGGVPIIVADSVRAVVVPAQ